MKIKRIRRVRKLKKIKRVKINKPTRTIIIISFKYLNNDRIKYLNNIIINKYYYNLINNLKLVAFIYFFKILKY
jgi:hypothetical protein